MRQSRTAIYCKSDPPSNIRMRLRGPNRRPDLIDPVLASDRNAQDRLPLTLTASAQLNTRGSRFASSESTALSFGTKQSLARIHNHLRIISNGICP
jgi:hypothetical protein